MAENSRIEAYDPSGDPKRKAKSKDPGWKYAFWPDLCDKNVVQCELCGRKVKGGIKRLKQHLAGGFGDVVKCSKTTIEISTEMHKALLATKRNRPIDLDMEDKVQVEQLDSCTQLSGASSVPIHVPSSGTISKRKKSFFEMLRAQQSKTVETQLRKTREDVVDEKHQIGSSQTTLENCLRTTEEKEKVEMHIANFFYECGVPFNAANTKAFEVMIESIGQYGSGLKPPTYHKLRVPPLEKTKKKIDEVKEKHMIAWKQYGCTLVSYGWTSNRGRHLINFFANSPEGTFFIGFADVSNESQDANMLAELIDNKIEEIGPKNVVQVVTDNASEYKTAGNMLMEKRPTLFWTPCAAHCIDLMLEDICNVKQFKTTIGRARRVTTFIYKHGRLLNALRNKINGKDLVKVGVTRFATTFLTLQSLYRHKDPLSYLFIGDDWMLSQLSKTEAGKRICDTVLSTSFWHDVEDCIRASQPLLVVLRILDSDEHPAMPEVFAAMEFLKKKIKENFDDNKRLYKKVIDIVERRWECQMEHMLYGAALFLNPNKCFEVKEQNPDLVFKLRGDFNYVLSKMVLDEQLVDKISDQADGYDAVRDGFAEAMVIRQRKLKNPIDWWNAFGCYAIDLAMFAKRILGLCCSSFGCERNGSTSEFIHAKMINGLDYQSLNDLVYIQYNRKIVSRLQRRRELGRNFDPLILEDVNWENEWVVNEREVVGSREDLTWTDVDVAFASSIAAGKQINPRSDQALSEPNISNVCLRRDPSISRAVVLQDSDSDVEEIKEDDFPSDDEDVDDYGERDIVPLELDDFI